MRRLVALSAVLVILAACGGDSTPRTSGGSSSAPPPPPPMTFDPAEITPAMLALGDSLFHGLIGAVSCQACHGADGNQATIAPNLTDGEWLHSDGSWQGIYTTITNGVMTPKQFGSVMPPFGGAPMTPEQTRAVAAYVYRLSHR